MFLCYKLIFYGIFSAMNILDGDDVRVSYNGVYAERDIVQVKSALLCDCVIFDIDAEKF